MNQGEQIIHRCANCGKQIVGLHGFESYRWRRYHKFYCSYSCYKGKHPTNFAALYGPDGHRKEHSNGH